MGISNNSTTNSIVNYALFAELITGTYCMSIKLDIVLPFRLPLIKRFDLDDPRSGLTVQRHFYLYPFHNGNTILLAIWMRRHQFNL